MDPERAHDRVLQLLNTAQRYESGRRFISKLVGEIPDDPVEILGLKFPNVVGLAAGFDKNATCIEGLAALGFGHIEVGTVTTFAQPGNPKPRIYREHGQSLVNSMGFPNDGAYTIAGRLRRLPEKRKYIVGVSIGKNSEVPLEHATSDYLTVLQLVYTYADYITINISSPNTQGLTLLQGQDYLENLLRKLKEYSHHLAGLYSIKPRPLLVKIAPNLNSRELIDLVCISEQYVDGIIATNTFKTNNGGWSGPSIFGISNSTIGLIRSYTDIPIIGVGGIMDSADAKRKLDLGANLVQVYTGLVYGGPKIVGRILRGINGTGFVRGTNFDRNSS